MDMDEMGFYSLNEQAIKQEIAYKKEKLSTEDILFSWVCTPKRFFVEEVFVFSMIIFSSLFFSFQLQVGMGYFLRFLLLYS
ncbi:TPA: hypothetical protein ACGUU0_001770 [Vibrio vulnificus]|uniref:hypothetical protein n=1 Tax=Vibrio vulnificus TaxID=672 RepID=UPI0032EE08AB